MPECMINRFPAIKLHERFKNTTAGPCITNGYFSFYHLAFFAQNGDRNLDISGVGDPVVAELCRGSIEAVSGDFRGYNCKKLMGLLQKYSSSENSMFGYLPSLSLVSLFQANNLENKCVLGEIDDGSFPIEQLN